MKTANTRIYEEKRKQKGFSLLEVAMALGLIGVLSIGMMNFYANSGKQRAISVAASDLEVAKSNLKKFYTVNHRLPCPDTDGDGFENCEMQNQYGILPYATLSMMKDTSNGAKSEQVLYGVVRIKTEGKDYDLTEKLNPKPASDTHTQGQEESTIDIFSRRLRALSKNTDLRNSIPFLSYKKINHTGGDQCSTSDDNNSAYVIVRYIDERKNIGNCFPLDDVNYIGKAIGVSPNEILGHLR